jgi:hypothetical protein
LETDADIVLCHIAGYTEDRMIAAAETAWRRRGELRGQARSPMTVYERYTQMKVMVWVHSS